MTVKCSCKRLHCWNKVASKQTAWTPYENCATCEWFMRLLMTLLRSGGLVNSFEHISQDVFCTSQKAQKSRNDNVEAHSWAGWAKRRNHRNTQEVTFLSWCSRKPRDEPMSLHLVFVPLFCSNVFNPSCSAWLRPVFPQMSPHHLALELFVLVLSPCESWLAHRALMDGWIQLVVGLTAFWPWWVRMFNVCVPFSCGFERRTGHRSCLLFVE